MWSSHSEFGNRKRPNREETPRAVAKTGAHNHYFDAALFKLMYGMYGATVGMSMKDNFSVCSRVLFACTPSDIMKGARKERRVIDKHGYAGLRFSFGITTVDTEVESWRWKHFRVTINLHRYRHR